MNHEELAVELEALRKKVAELEEGAKASVEKPYETRQLLGLIRKVLDENRQ